MTPEQKHRAAELLSAWRATAYALDADRMAALLQELVDAPEPEPVARVTGYYAGHLSIATVDGRVLPAGTALYLAPPAPSVPDGWKLVPVEPTPEPFGYFKAEPFGWTDCAETDDGAIALFDAPPAPTPAEAPADVEAINSIDARFCGRLALILECVILDPHGHFDLACHLLEEYKAEWEKVNPSPPTFMGEPMPHGTTARSQ